MGRCLISSIADFFKSNAFPRLAYSYGQNTTNDTVLTHPQIVAWDIATGISSIRKELGLNGNIFVFVERYSSGAYQYGRYLGEAFSLIGHVPEFRDSCTLRFGYLPKTTTLSGLEIADFIV